MENKRADYYDITNSCSLFITKLLNENSNKIFTKKQNNTIYKNISKVKCFDEIKKFYQSLTDLRNNLLHSNSGKQVRFTIQAIKSIVKQYEDLIIDNDYLNTQITIPTISNERISDQERKRNEKVKKESKKQQKKALTEKDEINMRSAIERLKKYGV